MKLSRLLPQPCLLSRVVFLFAAYVASHAQTVPDADVRPTPASSPDARFQQFWEAMKGRVPLIDELLLHGHAGEGLDGYLAASPGINLSSEEKTGIQEENVLRRQVYEEMSLLTGQKPEEMGRQRAQRFSPRLKKGIYREIVSASGTKEWVDGYTDAERIKTYVLEFAASPPERVEATKPFSISLQVKDALGRPAVHQSLSSALFSVASVTPSDGLAGTTTVPLVNGVAKFTGLTYPTVIAPTKLHFQGQGVLEHLKLVTPEIAVLEKTISPEDIESYLPAWERRAERLLKLPSSPSRDRELTDFRRTLESGIASIQSFSTASPLTGQKLKEMHRKVESALALAPSGPLPPSGVPGSLPPR